MPWAPAVAQGYGGHGKPTATFGGPYGTVPHITHPTSPTFSTRRSGRYGTFPHIAYLISPRRGETTLAVGFSPRYMDAQHILVTLVTKHLRGLPRYNTLPCCVATRGLPFRIPDSVGSRRRSASYGGQGKPTATFGGPYGTVRGMG